MCTGVISRRVKWLWCDFNHPLQSTTEIKNDWSHISAPPLYDFIPYIWQTLNLLRTSNQKNKRTSWRELKLKRIGNQISGAIQTGYQGTRNVTSGKASHYETKWWQNGHQGKWHKPSSTATSHAIVCYKKVWTRYEIFMCTPTNFNSDLFFFPRVTAFLPCHMKKCVW